MSGISRCAATVAVFGAVGLAGSGLGTGSASAAPPPPIPGGYTWCPGQPVPFGGLGWDMNVCHSYTFVPFGQGNVPMVDLQGNALDSWLWADSPPPPPPNAPP